MMILIIVIETPIQNFTWYHWILMEMTWVLYKIYTFVLYKLYTWVLYKIYACNYIRYKHGYYISHVKYLLYLSIHLFIISIHYLSNYQIYQFIHLFIISIISIYLSYPSIYHIHLSIISIYHFYLSIDVYPSYLSTIYLDIISIYDIHQFIYQFIYIYQSWLSSTIIPLAMNSQHLYNQRAYLQSTETTSNL